MNGLSVVARMRPWLVPVLYFAAVMIAPRTAWGQASTATIEGTVRSQPGAPVAGAEATGQGVRAVTDAEGRFRLVVVGGSPVELTVIARGYSPTRVSVGPLVAGSVKSVSVVLSSLATLDAVSVVAPRVRPLLNTANAVTGGSIEARELTSLPTDARDPIALLYNIPGITQATGFFGDAPRLSFNGGNSLYSQNLLDGLDNNEGFLGGPRVEVPLGAIARIDALVNTYSTQIGRSPDGIVDIASAAGRATLAGDLFLYQRPGRPLDARVPVTFGAEPNALARKQEGFQRVQAGGSLRGAINPTRTFFATAAEYTREQEDRIGSTAQAQFLGTETRQTWKGYGRLDHGWSPTQTTTLRLAASAVDRAGDGSGVLTPEADITTRRIGSLSALIHRSALRDGRASNTASVQFGTFRWYFPPARSDFSRPQVTVLAPDLSTQAIVGSSNFVFDETERQWQLRDVFETELGERHTLRLGGDVIAGAFRLAAASTNPNGSYVVFNDGNISPKAGRPLSISDIPANARVQSYTIDARPQQVNLSQALYSAFVEDTWRPTPSLTVVGGLRWDYDDLTSRGESDPDLDNVQPRVSFNWSRTGSDVIRGGVGRYAGKLPYAIYSDAIQLGETGNAVLTFSGASAPAFGAGPLPANIPNANVQSVPREIFRTFALGLEQPMSWQTTLGYQRQFGRAWAVSADLVWSETQNLPWTADLNPLARRLTAADSVPRTCASAFSCPGDASRPDNPATSGYRRVSTAQSGGSARYVAVYVAARRALTEHWQLDANWVWSRAQNSTEDINFSATQGNCFDTDRVDAVTGAACTSDEWADANNDRRHRVTVRTVYESPRGFTLSMIGDAQTGVPLNRLAGAVSGNGVARYDLLGSGPIRGNGFIGNADRFFGVARNAERLPGFVTIGASAAYRPRLKAIRGVELRADVFNLLNTLAWGGYANGIGGGGSRTQFGRPGDPVYLFSAAPPRQFQFSARYLFGERGAL
ncbi:TonB-dependent receptor [Gemmatimonas groenlandica]|uniref:TonB-dependent receptor n=1 Tax=Gemmatimonas groenlandica TaxID=2732249 RepID=A0A6M4INY6_9BACT|nr:carboxypeptidase regulatory-like domain-containing protein [Gemmatimonas groenlandica]QJR34682.1 TonB-dependent receptor [Gemmatimonas groenlandica]